MNDIRTRLIEAASSFIYYYDTICEYQDIKFLDFLGVDNGFRNSYRKFAVLIEDALTTTQINNELVGDDDDNSKIINACINFYAIINCIATKYRVSIASLDPYEFAEIAINGLYTAVTDSLLSDGE